MPAPLYARFDNALAQSAAGSRNFHPEFSLPDADSVMLRSFEGTLYRVGSYTLRTTSGLFDTIFSLPQPPRRGAEVQGWGEIGLVNSSDDSSEEEIPIYESDFVLERLLRLMYNVPIPIWESYDDLERVLAAAEKWDTPGPIANIRASLVCPQFLVSDPLRLYVLAKHFDWKEEAKLASTETLKLNLDDPIHAQALARLSSKDLEQLLNLHLKRREMFKKLIDSPERFAAGNRKVFSLWSISIDVDYAFSSPYHCGLCGVTQLDNCTWKNFKNAMFAEIDRRPLGDTLGVDTLDWPEAKACWEATCGKEGCGGLNYDRVATLKQIRNCIDVLPSTIEGINLW